jgi:hypothetical protein
MYAKRQGYHDVNASVAIGGDSKNRQHDQHPRSSSGPHNVADEQHLQTSRGASCEHRSTAITSSQSTIVEAEEDTKAPTEFIKIKPEPGVDDEAVFVSERNLKRKRKQEDRVSGRLRRIKRESDASQSLSQGIAVADDDVPAERYQLTKTMTSDLEVDGPTMQTPRKPRSEHRQSVHANFRAAEASDLRQTDQEASIPGQEAGCRLTSRRSSTIVKDEHLNAGQSRVLRQISGNVPAKKKDSTRTPRIRRKNAENHVAMLSEDGEFGPNGLEPAKRKEKDDEHQLDEMLRQPLSEKPMTSGKTSGKSVKHSARASGTPRLTPSKPSTVQVARSHFRPEKKSESNTRQRHTNNGTSTDGGIHDPRGPSPTRPEEEPLRIRNPDTLQLSDFKINPEYMGSNFAFTDTLRGREQRQGLHTCTRPDCCGDAFRRVIELGGNAASGKTDAQALDMYLGRDWSDVVSSLNPEKRKEMIMNAHVFALSHENGKHKHAFERRNTPPGFWRTDMPTTQEAADDRLKIVDLERQTVRERWLDATRGQGQWKFRNE